MAKFYPGEEDKLVKQIEEILLHAPDAKADSKLFAGLEKSTVKRVLSEKKKK